MITNDDNLERVEEIYLTEEQITHWLSLDTPRFDIFCVREGKVVLKDMDPAEELRNQPPPRNEMRALIERVYGPSKPSGNHVALRKIERPVDAVWTMFRHSGLVIGVHDDGTVVARDLAITNSHEFCITTGADFHCDGRLQEDADLKNSDVRIRVATMRDAVRLWVQRAKGRKIPQGLLRLWRRVRKAGEVNLLWGPNRIPIHSDC